MNFEIYFYNPNNSNFKNDGLIFPKSGLDCWIDLTVYKLNNYFQNDEIKLVAEIPESGIIFFHPKYFPKNLSPSRFQYFVCMQADLGRQRFAQGHIVQNSCQLNNIFTNRRSIFDVFFPFCLNFYMPHWSNPNLIFRNEKREDRIENVAFFGEKTNFDQNLALTLPGFLQEFDINFSFKDNDDLYYDYSIVDIALSIRSFPSGKYYNKPFWKIINSVISGSLVVASNESSSLEFRDRYFRDLPIVKSENELKKKLIDIKRNPKSYFLSIQKCKDTMRKEYDMSLTNRWIEFFRLAKEKLHHWGNLSEVERNFFLNYRKF